MSYTELLKNHILRIKYDLKYVNNALKIINNKKLFLKDFKPQNKQQLIWKLQKVTLIEYNKFNNKNINQ